MISIIIPTFNDHDIHFALESVLSQTFNDWEIFIVDDGSDPEHRERLNKWESKKIRILQRDKQLPKGANTCRNIGMDSAHGEFIALLDADDYWLPTRLEKALNFFDGQDTDAIYSGGIIESPSGCKKRLSREMGQGESSIDFLLSNDSWAPTPSMIFRSSVKTRFDTTLKRHQDYDFFIRLNIDYKWTYLDNYDVVVRWDGNEVKKVDFESCLVFYSRNKEFIRNKTNELLYLFGLWKLAWSQNDNVSEKRIKRLMRKVSPLNSYKLKTLSYFPELALWKESLT